jgi:hypothetical protein
MTLDDLVTEFRRHLWLPDPTPLYVVLATVIANHFRGDPVWLLVVGPPASGKTELLSSLARLDDVHEVSTFTKAGLLSAASSRNPNATGGLLAELGTFGIIVPKDFTSLLSESPETRSGVFAALREIYDGQWIRHVGSDGGKTLAWRGKVGLIAAVTETIDRHLATIGAMGERFVFCRMPPTDDAVRLAQARAALEAVGGEDDERRRRAELVREFLAPFVSNGDAIKAELRVDPDWLAILADFATRCRSVVERDIRDRQVELVPQPEATGRLTKELAQLARGLHAIGLIEADLYPILTGVALDGLPKVRRLVIEQLVATRLGRELTASELGDQIGLNTDVTSRALDDLAAHGVAERQSVPLQSHRWGPSEWLCERWESLAFTHLTTGTDSNERPAIYDDEPF